MNKPITNPEECWQVDIFQKGILDCLEDLKESSWYDKADIWVLKICLEWISNRSVFWKWLTQYWNQLDQDRKTIRRKQLLVDLYTWLELWTQKPETDTLDIQEVSRQISELINVKTRERVKHVRVNCTDAARNLLSWK